MQRKQQHVNKARTVPKVVFYVNAFTAILDDILDNVKTEPAALRGAGTLETGKFPEQQ
jgi:hypothetical protein